MSRLGLPQFSVTVRADRFVGADYESAMGAGGGLRRSQRRAAGNAGAFADRVGCAAMTARYAPQPIRQLMGRAEVCYCLLDGSPNFFAELNTFEILSEIIQPREQTEWVAKRRPGGLTDTRRDAQPGLLTEFDHYAVFHLLDAHCERGLPARHRSHSCGDLHCHLIFLSDGLRLQGAAVELSHQGLSNVAWCDVAVENSSLHDFDYNPLHQRRRFVVALYISMNLYARNQIWFKQIIGSLFILCLLILALFSPRRAEAFQGAPTPTGPVITVTYTDPMNVRAGPGTFYDIIGQLFPNDVRPALGISPGREWIQISFEGGIGWVYASYVSVSGGELQVVEPPPTPTPLVTSTFDPTFAAAFNRTPTVTRIPTFTPPPPLTPPQFTEESSPRVNGVPSGYFILILGLLGLAGLFVSIFSQR